MSSEDVVIDVRNLSKRYEVYAIPRDRLKQMVLPRLYRAVAPLGAIFGRQSSAVPPQYFREFWALRDVSFQVARGETVGIIGRNGAGKSTLLQLVCGILSPTCGSVETKGKIAALLELGSGFNPQYTGRENVYMSAALLGLSSEEVGKRFEEIAAFADIGDFIEQPVKTYSSGMTVRLAFAVNILSSPEILIVDEALAVGDMLFQQKCFARLRQMKANGVSILFVSHDISSVRTFCDKAIYLKNGKEAGQGAAIDIAKQYEFECLGEKSRQHSAVPVKKDLQPENLDKEIKNSLGLIKQYENRFLERSRIGNRQGTNKLVFLACEFLSKEGKPTESLLPEEEVTAMFLVQANKDYRGNIHIGMQIHQKNGAQVAVVRDSFFEKEIQIADSQYLTAKMKFIPRLRGGGYYGSIGISCFPERSKFINDVINSDQMEIADFVEIGVVFKVNIMKRHVIGLPVLIETTMETTIENSSVSK